MDLNDLYYRRGVSLLRARLSASVTARSAHARLAALYEARIAGLRQATTDRLDFRSAS